MYTPKELIESRPKITDQSAMEDLLEKTRAVSKVLQASNNSTNPDYQRLAKLMCDLSAANVYLINKEGEILGYSWINEYNCPIMTEMLTEKSMPESYVKRVNSYSESVLNHSDLGFCAYADQPCTYSNKNVLLVPINGGGDRLGTLILARFGSQFDTRDLVLAEYLGTVVGVEILNDKGRTIEYKAREQLVVQMAIKALSYSEIESIKHIIKDLKGYEGIVVASSVADRIGVTRSVIVNALRKLGSSGIIESRSLGMKGTYIKVLCPLFFDELGVRRNR
ncbi:MAG: GTP-sensing pleiotropic transcriptional regulator CodY [Synergistaceae bacterium]